MVDRVVTVGDDLTLPPAVKAADGNLPVASRAAAIAAKANAADVVPNWKTATAYVAGDKVISPNGDVVSSIANHTSGASFTAGSWNLSPSYATPASVPPIVTSTVAADASLSRKTDPGVPNTFTDEANAYSHVWKTPGAGGRLLAGFKKAGGWFYLPKGFDYADRKVRVTVNDQYLSGSVDRNGRVMEDALDLQGNVPLNTLTRWGARLAASALTAATYPFTPKVKVTTKTVKKDGTGDFTTIGAAIASITDSSLTNTYVILIHPGVYAEYGLKPSTGVYLWGTHRDRCIIKGELPANVTDTAVMLASTVDLYDPSGLRSLTITGKNLRYPVHYEGAGKNPDSSVYADNCHIEHFGNQEIRDWRDANPGSGMLASTVWNSWIAWGEGAASGVEVDITRTTLRGRSTFFLHGTSDQAKPTNHRIKTSRLIGLDQSGGKSVFTINPIGSGTDDELTITDTVIDTTYIQHQDGPWQTQKPESQFADHYEIRLVMSGCSLVGWITNNRGKALRIASATTGATSTVRVSGTAADVIFGASGLWKFRDGGGGLAGYAYGYWDISGILCGVNSDQVVANTLGRRLGDCSTVNKTLTVTVDGGAPVNVVFNTDLTAATNASIIATINTALGATATASEYLVTQGERYPEVLDRESELANTGTVGIPRFAAVKYGADQRGVQIMGTADPVALFVGIALEPIAPGKAGRILFEGKMRYDQLFGFSGGINAGDAISLSTVTAGAFVTGASKQIATASALDWARFKGNR